ncbi:TcpE family conjugal transfer membrane protein [Ectobacillus funiculus]|uniref:TcpE family conjugal transfer membrane protein n=1 Tax=Ectobacillus funiculus TaxID=137993 RepID=A0ABV5WA55_9BACI
MRKEGRTYGVLFRYPPKIYKMHDYVFPKGLELRQIGGYIALILASFFFRNTKPLELIRTLPFALWITIWFLAPWYIAGLLLKIRFEDKKILNYLTNRFKYMFQKKEYVRFRPLETRGKKIFKYDGVNRDC